MRTKRWFVAALICAFLMGTVAIAAADYQEDTWFIGAQGGYFSVPGISTYYDEYGSISGAPVGVQSGYSWSFIEVVGLLENWTVNMPETDWLVQGGDPEDMTRVKSTSLGMVSLEAMARFKIRKHPIVQPIFSVGLGLGFPYGTVESRDYDAFGNFETEWEEKNIGVVPILDLLVGCRFVAHPNFVIDVNLGFKNGLYAGIGFLYFN